MKKKITYENGFGPRETFDYESVESLIDSFRKAYGEESAKRIRIISVEEISAEELEELRELEAIESDYFARFGTANE